MKRFAYTIMAFAAVGVRSTGAGRPARSGLHRRKGSEERGGQSTVGVGGRCSPAEAAKDIGQRCGRRSATRDRTKGTRRRRHGMDATTERSAEKDQPIELTTGQRCKPSEVQQMKIKLAFVVACMRPVVSYRLCRAAAHGRLGAAVPADAVGERCRAAPAGFEARAACRRPSHLPKDAPNILIILLDDVGFGLADTYGGPIHTPTLSRIANAGISYNAFHTTAICSPTRAALLTGRNHQRVGSGTIAERAVDWDGYTGVIPRTLSGAAESARRIRLQDAPRSANGTTRPRPRPPRWVHSRCGRRAKASASTISTGFSPARRRSGSRGCSRTSTRSNRRTIRSTT